MNKVNIAIYMISIPNIEKYSSMFDLYEVARNDSRFNFEIMYNRLTNKRGLRDFVNTNSDKYKFIRFNKNLVTGDNPYFDYVFIINPYARPILPYDQWTSKIIYDEYGASGLDASNFTYADEFSIYSYATKVITDGLLAKKSIDAKLGTEGTNKVINSSPLYDYPKFRSKARNPKYDYTIIWSPHGLVWDKCYYNKMKGRYSTFSTYHELFVSELPNRYPNILFKIKLHPDLRSRIIEAQSRGKFNESFDLDTWIDLVNRNDNVEFLGHTSYYDEFVNSDAIMNDSISFVLEYLPTNNPMLVLRDKDKIPYSNYAEGLINKCYYNANNSGEIYDFIDNVVINKNDPKFIERSRFLLDEGYIYDKNKTNSESLLDLIYEDYLNK